MICKLLLKLQVSLVVASHDHQTARSLVQAMNDSRTLLPSQNGKLPHCMQQPMDQGAGIVSFGGMNNHPRRLVDDSDVLILVADVQIEILRHQLRLAGQRGPPRSRPG